MRGTLTPLDQEREEGVTEGERGAEVEDDDEEEEEMEIQGKIVLLLHNLPVLYTFFILVKFEINSGRFSEIPYTTSLMNTTAKSPRKILFLMYFLIKK